MSWRSRLAELRLLVQPPAAPFGAPVDWASFESENGFVPPTDYRALLDRYGAGQFEAGVGRLVLLQPRHPKRSFLAGNKWIRDNLRGLQRRFPEMEPPWPIYPDHGGFLPFAADDTSWTIGWLTQGGADEWTTCIDGGRDGWWNEIPVGAAELVLRWCRGDLGIPEVDRANPGGSFLSHEQDEYWSPSTETARVVFGPSRASASLASRDIEWVRARLAPAKIQSFGSSGDANNPLHAEISVGYRPQDDAAVLAAVQRFAAELGTKVVAAYALDESPIWPDLANDDPEMRAPTPGR